MLTIQECTDKNMLLKLYNRAGMPFDGTSGAFIFRENDKALAACLFDRKNAELFYIAAEKGAPDFAAEAAARAVLNALERAGHKSAHCKNAGMRRLALRLGFVEKGGGLSINLAEFIQKAGHCSHGRGRGE